MRPKTIVLLLVAVVCGLVAALAASKLLSGFGGPRDDPTLEVWVAKDDIKQDTKIEKPEEMFERRRLLKERLPKNVLAVGNPADLKGKSVTDKPTAVYLDRSGNPADLKDKYVTRPLAKDQFVTQNDIDKQVPVITPPPGKVLKTLPVTAEEIAGGFVLPTSRVDVIWTGEDPNPRRAGARRSEIKLQDLLVMAVDHTTGRQADAKGPSVVNVSTVTLAVTDLEAKQLLQIKEGSKLRLILRGPEDRGKGETKGAISAQDPDMGEDPVVAEPVEVPVARDYLPAKTHLDFEKHFIIRRFPERPRDALTVEEIKKGDKVLKHPVAAGEFVSSTVDVGDGKEAPVVEGPSTEPGKKAPLDNEKPPHRILIIEGSKVRNG
jgi:Flp pilus assembly protein CpaB